jgi:xanthine dehydrogenase YagT iron-sulfur-binding subunit
MAPKDDFNPSRRNFLKTVGAVGTATSVITFDAEAQTGAPRVVGPGEVPIQLTVNGRRYDTRIEPRATLLDTIRNRFDLTGQKRVCNRGTCGACTVIIDGRTYYSCSQLAIEWQGKNIRTVEGLTSGERMHPVQQAFVDQDAQMCGFCTPGMVMASVALLERYPNATPEQMKRELDGNICRCGTYPHIFKAIAQAKGVARG